MIERTLILVKPDGVERSLVGKIITRFEDAGLKIIGMKMHWADKQFALMHYTDDISKRRGEHIRKALVDYIIEGPVVAVVLEGIQAVEVVRKLSGDTESRVAPPGTIRGDFSHGSYAHADEKKGSLKNVIHASANAKEAAYEINLWFKKEELHSYKTVHEKHTFA